MTRLFLFALGAFTATSVVAQEFDAALQPSEPKQQAETPAAVQVDPVLAAKLTSPAQTMQTFREAMRGNGKQMYADAIICLDLSGLKGGDVIAAKQEELVYRLDDILDRMIYDYDALSIPTDEDYDAGAYSLGEAEVGLTDDAKEDAEKIVISKSTDGLWRFSVATVAQIESMHELWRAKETLAGLDDIRTTSATKPLAIRIEELFPERLHHTHFLLPDYQWICLILLIFLGFFADFAARFLLHHVTSAWLKFIVKTDEEHKAEKRVWKPVGLLVQALVWYAGARLILPARVLEVLLVALKFFAIVAGVWTSFRAVDLLASLLTRKAEKTSTRFDDLIVPLVSQSLKILAVCVALVVVAQTYNWPLTGLIGGLGIGGMALAFASKDAVSNLFGSMTILMDRPFEIGDWIVTEGVEGTVETVGFRSSRIRTFYNSIITVPNSRLTTALVDNMGRRRFRRIRVMLGVQYDTSPDQIEAFCEGIRELLRRHPYTRKDYYHVYLNQFGPSSLDILLYCFIACPDWSVELRERHRLFVDMIKLAGRLGVSFAFPTQTLHMFKEDASQNEATALENPILAGRQGAAEIAGPLPSFSELPGPVRFPGPSDD